MTGSSRRAMLAWGAALRVADHPEFASRRTTKTAIDGVTTSSSSDRDAVLRPGQRDGF